MTPKNGFATKLLVNPALATCVPSISTSVIQNTREMIDMTDLVVKTLHSELEAAMEREMIENEDFAEATYRSWAKLFDIQDPDDNVVLFLLSLMEKFPRFAILIKAEKQAQLQVLDERALVLRGLKLTRDLGI